MVLEDGSVFEGRAVATGTAFGEVVFNTSMTGYQEILTDPSYRGQIVIMTQPHIGNYGISPEVAESTHPWVEGFVASQFTAKASSHGSEEELISYLGRNAIPSLDELDTRAIVRRVRESGALRGVVTTEHSEVEALLRQVRDSPPMTGRALVDEVTCEAAYEVPAAGGDEVRAHLAVYDYGVKTNILRSLSRRGARLTVLPARTPARECLDLGIDGVLLSNGPGDPEPLVEIVEIVRDLAQSGVPVFGICLGHQLLGLAHGGSTFKLKFGHHGGNQPVLDFETGRVIITSQNHGFAVDPESLPDDCRVSQVNLNDRTVEGFVVDGRPVFSAQYHPEAAPGPHEASVMFDRFLASLQPS
jgi:carbamoyl-phosphate synthase small subunit